MSNVSTIARKPSTASKAAPKTKPAAKASKGKPFELTATESSNIMAAITDAEKASKALRDVITKYAQRAKRAKIKRVDAGHTLAAGLGFDKMADTPKSLQNAWQYVAAQVGLESRKPSAKKDAPKSPRANATADKAKPVTAMTVTLADAVGTGPEALAAKLCSLLLDHQVEELIDALRDQLEA